MIETKDKCRDYDQETLYRKMLTILNMYGHSVTKVISKIFQGIRKTNNALSFRLELKKVFMSKY